MAENFTKVNNTARVLAMAHILVGFLLFCFGIADRVAVENYRMWFMEMLCLGIWAGIWMCITGGLGLVGTRREPRTSRKAFATAFMGFSIASASFGAIIVISYSISIHSMTMRDSRYRMYPSFDTAVIILILSSAEVVIGIWAAVCLNCSTCCCCTHTSTQQAPDHDGPVAVPMQEDRGMVTVQSTTPGAQEYQPQMILLPEVVDNLPPPYELMATGHQTLQVDMPPSYEEAVHSERKTYV